MCFVGNDESTKQFECPKCFFITSSLIIISSDTEELAYNMNAFIVNYQNKFNDEF